MYIFVKKMMTSVEFNSNIVEGYVGLLENLSPDNKLSLISKLSKSIKEDLKPKKSIMRKAFGAFESSLSAEEIIEDLRKNRKFTRITESL